jgi:hypothetical protein
MRDLAVIDARPAADAAFERAGMFADHRAQALPPAPLVPEVGLERRLVRRAEVLWDRARGNQPMPCSNDAAPLLAPPFMAFALHIAVSGDATATRATIAFAGEALRRLIAIPADGAPVAIAPDRRPGAPLLGQLHGLAVAAITAGQPAPMDGEITGGTAEGSGTLLLRAIALPLCDAGGRADAAIVVARWRQLLGEAETHALHGEIARLLSRDGFALAAAWG